MKDVFYSLATAGLLLASMAMVSDIVIDTRCAQASSNHEAYSVDSPKVTEIPEAFPASETAASPTPKPQAPSKSEVLKPNFDALVETTSSPDAQEKCVIKKETHNPHGFYAVCKKQ